MSRKAFTVGVVATTIAWSIGLSALLAPLSAGAVAAGTLVKASLPAVYYVGSDMKRYVFPNEKTYKTWYADFSSVQTITDAELAAMTIGGNVTYKPGVKMVKITTDPKVYAVDAHGALRWVNSEVVAVALYGASWNQMIDDVSDAFFTNYTIGADISAVGQFYPAMAAATATSINVDKGLGTSGTVSGQLTAMLSSSQPVGGSLPRNATGVNMVKFDLRNSGSSAMTVDSLTVRRQGLGVAGDIAKVYVYEGNDRLTTDRSINATSNEATFSGLNLTLAAGETKSLWIAADIANTTVGNVNNLSIVSVNAGSIMAAGLPVSGPSFTWTGATVGGVTVDKNALTTKPKAGQNGAKLVEFKLTAAVEDILINKVALYYNGTVSRTNISNLVLKQAGLTVASVSGLSTKDQATFVFSNPFSIEKGNSRTFEVFADIGGSARSTENVSFYVDQPADIGSIGKTYGYGVAVTNNFGSAAAQVLAVEAGQLNLSFNGPASKDIAANAKDVELFNFSMSAAANLEVKRTRLDLTGTTALADIVDLKIVDTASGAIVAGPVDPATAASCVANVCSFTEVYNLAAGQTRTFKVTADVISAAAANDAVKVSLVAFATGVDVRNLDNSTYLVTADMVPSANIAGNAHVVKKASLGVSVGSNPVSQTYIQGSQGISLVGFGLKAGDAADITVSSIKITGYIDRDGAGVFVKGTDGLAILSDELLTASLWDGTTQVGQTKSPGAGADGTMTFDGLNLVIGKGQTKGLLLKGVLTSSIATLVADVDRIKFDIAANTDITATDPEGNQLVAGTDLLGAPINQTTVDAGVRMTVKAAGTVAVALAPDDSESEAGLVVGSGSNVVLAKYKFTAVDEELKATKLGFQVTTAAAVTSLSLYDGSTLVGGPAGIDGSGNAHFTGLNFVIPKDGSKVLTVKGNLSSVGSTGATTGNNAKVTLKDTAGAFSFEVRGTSAGSSTTIVAITGGDVAANNKIMRKSKPTISLVSLPSTTLVAGENVVTRVTIAADAAGDVSLKGLALQVQNGTTGAITDPAAVATSAVRRVGDSTNLAGKSAMVGGADCATTATCVLVTTFTNEEVISAGQSRTYDIRLSVVTAAASTSVVSKLLGDAGMNTGALVVGVPPVKHTVATVASNFVWSDMSAVSHGVGTADWADGTYVKILPTDTQTLSK
jgi:hypothetical protein